MSERNAFVIMPIGVNGSEDARRYEKLYSDFIEKTLKTKGYAVSRADKIPRSGSIFKEIIKRIIESDLVVADLTTLNPNVMLELGIRYACIPNGTVLICDRSKTETLPFDLKDYRTIFFDESRDSGVYLLRSLEDFSDQISHAPAGNGKGYSIDSPVFSHYDLERRIQAEAALRDEIATLKGQLAELQSMAQQKDDPRGKDSLSPELMLSKAIAENDAGNVPWELLSRAEAAVTDRNRSEFLACVQKIMGIRAITLSDREYRDLYYLAEQLDLRNVLPTIIEIGLSQYPDSDQLFRAKMGYLAHSVHQKERQVAEDSISKKLRIDLSKGVFDSERIVNAGSDIHLLSIYLDAVHRDGHDEIALKITKKLYDAFPTNSVVVRNYARAVQRMGDPDKSALELYKDSVRNCPDVDDTSARWLSNELWDRKLYRGAIEVAVIACMIDLDDAGNFATLATQVSQLLQPRNIFTVASEDHVSLEDDDLITTVVYGRSCPIDSSEARAAFEMAMRNANISQDSYQDRKDELGLVSRRERAEFIKILYSRFGSGSFIGNAREKHAGSNDVPQAPARS